MSNYLRAAHCSCSPFAPRWSRAHTHTHTGPHNRRHKLTACSFGWWLMAGADLLWEKSTAGWLLVAGLFWEKSTAGWWLISRTNRL
jgi:hypothetical protein